MLPMPGYELSCLFAQALDDNAPNKLRRVELHVDSV